MVVSASPDPPPEDVLDYAAAMARELAQMTAAAGATASAALFRQAASEAAREKALLRQHGAAPDAAA